MDIILEVLGNFIFQCLDKNIEGVPPFSIDVCYPQSEFA